MGRSFRRIALCGAALLFAGLAGCVETEERWVELPARAAEVPPANVPLGLRQANWPDARGSGSCVIASSISHLHWHNRPDLAAKFRRSYAGGQTATSIKQIWRANEIPYAVEERGRPEFLDWASRTRRGAIIWYFPSHCCTFVGFGSFEGRQWAFVLDNNRVGNFVRIPKQQFIAEWRRYGGFAMTALLSPAPPVPYRGYEVR